MNNVIIIDDDEDVALCAVEALACAVLQRKFAV